MKHSREFQEHLNDATVELQSGIRTCVSTYTENAILDGQEPTYEEYVKRNPEHDHEPLIDLIVSEMERITILCRGVSA